MLIMVAVTVLIGALVAVVLSATAVLEVTRVPLFGDPSADRRGLECGDCCTDLLRRQSSLSGLSFRSPSAGEYGGNSGAGGYMGLIIDVSGGGESGRTVGEIAAAAGGGGEQGVIARGVA